MARVGERHRVFIHTNASIRDEVLRIFDSTFAITYALEAIAVLVGILGVSGTLLTLILERRRELTTLRLVGADRRQVRKMVVIEAGMIGVVSQVLGLFAGFGLALILIYVINVQSFGWSIQFYIPGLFIVQSSIALSWRRRSQGCIRHGWRPLCSLWSTTTNESRRGRPARLRARVRRSRRIRPECSRLAQRGARSHVFDCRRTTRAIPNTGSSGGTTRVM